MATIILTYKYRILPTPSQHRALALILESQRQLYNAALEERIDCYRKTGKGLSYVDQCKSLTQCRASVPGMGTLPANLQRATLKRIDTAFHRFFDRVKRGQKTGFPRFKGIDWFNSFGFAEFSGVTFDGKRLRFKGMPGGLRVHMHRPMPIDAKPFGCTIKRYAKGWSVAFVVRLEPNAHEQKGHRNVGLDLGLKDLVVASDGFRVPNQRKAARAERKLRQRQRALSRCKRGSARRHKIKALVRRTYLKVTNARTTYLHQQSAHIASVYDLIAVENLKIDNMRRSAKGTASEPGINVAQKRGLNRSIADAAWGRLLTMIAYKAARAGARFVRVDSRFTSQICSKCGYRDAGNRPTRDNFKCLNCKHEDDADINAARNILARAVVGPGVLNVADSGERALGNLTPQTEVRN